MHHLVPYNHREVENKWDRNLLWHNKCLQSAKRYAISSIYKDRFERVNLNELKFYTIADVYNRYSMDEMVSLECDNNFLNDAKYKDVLKNTLADWLNKEIIIYRDHIAYIDITNCYDRIMAFHGVNIDKNYKNAEINWINQHLYMVNDRTYLKFEIMDEDRIIKDINRYVYAFCDKSCYCVCSESDNLKYVLQARVLSHKLYIDGIVSNDEPFENILVVGDLYQLDEDTNRKVKISDEDYDTRYLYMDYGSDCISMYLMFIGPLKQNSLWDESALDGIYRFFRRLWNMVMQNIEQGFKNETIDDESLSEMQKVYSSFQEKMYHFQFNVAISEVMSYCKKLCKKTNVGDVCKEEIQTLLKMVYTFAPCIASELKERVVDNNSK